MYVAYFIMWDTMIPMCVSLNVCSNVSLNVCNIHFIKYVRYVCCVVGEGEREGKNVLFVCS